MNEEKIKMKTSIEQFDEWLKDDSPAAALVMRQWLVPIEGKDAVIFPPTYAKPERMKEEEWLGYNIDRFEDGSNVCLIDSVGSQANRMEELFKREPYNKLVPRVIVRAKDKSVNLLDAGHRAADAIVRFSSLSKDFEEAFEALKSEANAEPLAKISPTSIVFGVWDSRMTQVKLPRIVRSVIRAFDVKPMHRSAQYIPPIDYVEEGLLDKPESKSQQDSMSQLGLSHAPAPWTHGGVEVKGGIRRDATLNLVALRALGAKTNENTLKLRRYILGLALISFTAPQETFLREGCELVPDPERPVEWNIVHHDGQRKPFAVSHDDVLKFAQMAAEDFKVGPDKEGIFDAKIANEALRQSKEERKKAQRTKGEISGE